MYCTGCGQELVPGAVVCPRCGRPAGVMPVPVIYNRVHRHTQTLGVLWLVYAGWTVLGYFLALPFLLGMRDHWFWFGHMGMDSWPWHHMPWFLPLVTVILLFRTILSAVTGIALMQRAPWARVLGIVAAVLTILKPITGTLLAIYTLWVLAPRLSGMEWERMTQPGYPPMRG